MRYGHFDDDAREYVITTPHTPYPWINYLGSRGVLRRWSRHRPAATAFYRDAKMRRLTRYRYNNIPADAGGRYFYVNDGGDVWTPSWLPVKADLDSFEAAHGMGYTRITGARGGLSRRDAAVFVPLGRHRRDPAGRGHQHVDAAKDRQAVLVRRVLPVERPGRPDQLPAQPLASARWRSRGRRRRSTTRPSTASAATTTPSTASTPPVAGFDTDRDTFLGAYNGFGEPRPCRRGKAADSVASGWYPIGSHSIEVALAPGERAVLTSSCSGYVENAPATSGSRAGVDQQGSARTRCSARFATDEQVDAAPGALWPTTGSGLLSTLHAELAGREARPHGQHLEPVPVHGHLQHVPLGLVLRVGHRPRHGLPRLQPGPAGLRAPGPRARPRAHPRHRRDAVRGRRRRTTSTSR